MTSDQVMHQTNMQSGWGRVIHLHFDEN